jgi:hypothetical protein
VPLSGGGTANFLRADGQWTTPPGVAGVSNSATFSYNATTTEPPTGNQLRLNNTTFSAATRLWVMQTTVDGLDVSIGLARILPGHQVYFQDRDDASHWVKYNVTAATDDGVYFDFTVTYHSGPGGIPAGQVEFQAIAPGTVGVPPGGTTGQVLNKTSSTDYAVDLDDSAIVGRRRPVGQPHADGVVGVGISRRCRRAGHRSRSTHRNRHHSSRHRRRGGRRLSAVVPSDQCPDRDVLYPRAG